MLGRRIGSVGRMVPGLSARIRDPETNEDLGLFQTGMLWLRGANIFEGYFKETDQTTAVLQDGWYKTGDVGRIDEDGFLFIEGRMSRFSKIAGEMVPHLTVEQKIVEALDLHPAHGEGPAVAVVGVPDEKRGESLVPDHRDRSRRPSCASGCSRWGCPISGFPRSSNRSPAIPILATGKLDMRECRAGREASRRSRSPGDAMTILGIGMDIVETKRIADSIERFGDRFLHRVFLDGEVAYSNSMKFPHLHLAARFAAKEAISKAFGTGIGREMGWRDLEIVREPSGEPRVVLAWQARAYAEARGVRDPRQPLPHRRLRRGHRPPRWLMRGAN